MHPLTPPGLPHRHFRPVILRTWGLNNVGLDFRRSKYIQNMDNFGSSVPLYSLIFRFCLPPAPHIQDPPELSGGKLAHVECSFYHFSGVLKLVAIAQNFRTPEKWFKEHSTWGNFQNPLKTNEHQLIVWFTMRVSTQQ